MITVTTTIIPTPIDWAQGEFDHIVTAPGAPSQPLDCSVVISVRSGLTFCAELQERL